MFHSTRDSPITNRLVLLFYYDRKQNKGYYSTFIENLQDIKNTNRYTNNRGGNNNKNVNSGSNTTATATSTSTSSSKTIVYEKQDIVTWKEFSNYIGIIGNIDEKEFFILLSTLTFIYLPVFKLHKNVLQYINIPILLKNCLPDNSDDALIKLDSIYNHKTSTCIFYYENIPLCENIPLPLEIISLE